MGMMRDECVDCSLLGFFLSYEVLSAQCFLGEAGGASLRRGKHPTAHWLILYRFGLKVGGLLRHRRAPRPAPEEGT